MFIIFHLHQYIKTAISLNHPLSGCIMAELVYLPQPCLWIMPGLTRTWICPASPNTSFLLFVIIDVNIKTAHTHLCSSVVSCRVACKRLHELSLPSPVMTVYLQGFVSDTDWCLVSLQARKWRPRKSWQRWCLNAWGKMMMMMRMSMKKTLICWWVDDWWYS